MKQKATLYKASGPVVEVFPHDGRKFSLEELQGFVGGHIEKVPGTARRGEPIAYCNEDGLRLELGENVMASEKFGLALVGNVLQVFTERLVRDNGLYDDEEGGAS